MGSGLKRSLKNSYTLRFAAWLLYFNFIDLLAMIWPVRDPAKHRKRVVFVKLDGIGDFVIWTASFDAYREIYPADEFERILIGSDKWAGIAEFEPTFERKIFVNNEKLIFSPLYRFRIMREIRNLGADVVVNQRLTRDFLWGDSIVRCSGAPVKIGSEGLDNLMTYMQERLSVAWYTQLVPKALVGEHELLSNLRFVKSIRPEIKLDMSPPSISGITESDNFNLTGDYAIYFVSAMKADKRWQPEKFAETARFVSENYGYQTVVCGGPGDERLAEAFDINKSSQAVNLVGRTSLADLKRLIDRAKLVVTNDTGAGHIAAAASRPTVVITPGNNVGRFFPYPKELTAKGVNLVSVLHEMPCFGCGWTCIYKDLAIGSPNPCVSEIQVSDVTDAIEGLIGVAPKPADRFEYRPNEASAN